MTAMTIDEAIAKLEVYAPRRDPVYEDTMNEVLLRMKRIRGLAFGLLDPDTLVVSETVEKAINNVSSPVQQVGLNPPEICAFKFDPIGG